MIKELKQNIILKRIYFRIIKLSIEDYINEIYQELIKSLNSLIKIMFQTIKVSAAVNWQ